MWTFSRLLALAILAVAECSAGTAEPITQSPGSVVNGPMGQSIDLYAQSASALGFAGTLLVARGHDLILNKGYGWADREARIPNGSQTAYYIASLSKQFTAAAILKLESAGKLRTSDRVAAFLKNVPADKAAITIHHLLTHTSGLPRVGWDEDKKDWQEMGRDAAVAAILKSKLVHEPGKTFLYENSNYLLLAAIVEAASGSTFQTFVRSQLFQPANIPGARLGNDDKGEVVSPRLALGYSDGLPVRSYLGRPRTWLRVGSGNALLTVADLYRWHRALRDGVVLPAPERTRLFTMQTVIEPGFGYAYGWWVRQSGSGASVIFHGGDFEGYHSEFRWYPQSDLTLIVATNDEFHGTSLAEPVLNHVAAILKGQPSPLPSVISLGTQHLGRCAGNYYLEKGGWLTVSTADGMLNVEAAGPAAAEILGDGEPGLAQARHVAGDRTLDLVGRLKRHEPGAYSSALDSGLRSQEFADEWQELYASRGRLRSYQLLSTVSEARGVSVSYVRLNFDCGSIVLAYAWKNDKLQYTLPGARPEPGRVVFAPCAPAEFKSFDWRTERLRTMRFWRDETGGFPELKLSKRDGTFATLKRREVQALKSVK